MFDIDAARREGYTTEEIAKYLASKHNFDAEGALREGYSPNEIIFYLVQKEYEAKQRAAELEMIKAFQEKQFPSISALKEQPVEWWKRSLPELLGIVPVRPQKVLREGGATPEEIARAKNIVAIYEETGLSPSFVEEHYDDITQKLGLRGIPTKKELFESAMLFAIPAGLATAPISAITGLGTFIGAKELESILTQFFKGEKINLLAGRELKEFLGPLDEPLKTTVDILEYVVPGLLGAKFMAIPKEKLTNRLKSKVIHEAWDNYLKTQEKVKFLPPGQGFIMKEPPPEVIRRPLPGLKPKGPVEISPEGEPIYPPGIKPIIEELPEKPIIPEAWKRPITKELPREIKPIIEETPQKAKPRLAETKEPIVTLEQLKETPSLADYVIKRPEIHDKAVLERATEIKEWVKKEAEEITKPEVLEAGKKLIGELEGKLKAEGKKMPTEVLREKAKIGTEEISEKTLPSPIKFEKVEKMTPAKEGVEHGAGAVSVEELARPGINYSISKTGKVGYLGKQVDLPPGAEAVISVLPDGKLQVRATRPGLSYKNAEAKYGEKVRAAFRKATEEKPSLESLEAQVKGGPAGVLPKYAEGSAINLQRIESTNDILNFMNGLTKSLEKRIGKERITWEKSRQEAEALGWNVDDLRKAWQKKGSFKHSEIEASRQLNINAVSDLHEMLRTLPAGHKGYTPEQRAMLLDAIDTVRITSQAATEAGRSLNVHKRVLRKDPNFREVSEINRALKALVGKNVKRADEIIDALRVVASSGNPADVNRFVYKISKSNWEKISDAAWDSLNIPKTVLASMDFSAPLRQGIFLIGRPKEFFPAFGAQFKYFFSDKAFQGLLSEIEARPTYELMLQAKLPFTTMGELGLREERFMSSLINKIPIFGQLVKASNRAYTGFLNKLRADVFDAYIKQAQKEGIEFTPKFLQDLGGFIGNATGRGSLGKLERDAVALNAIFFSPRLASSRLHLLNPVYYIRLDPFVRKQALKSLLSFTGIGLMTLGLAKLGGLDIGTEPRSADFGKIKKGNTRYDIWGGFQPYIRLGAQIITGEHISSTTGVKTTMGEGYKPLTRREILERFFETKEAPYLTFVNDLLRGQTYRGKEFDIKKEVVERFIPMIAQDAYDLYKEGGVKEIPLVIPGIFGVGAQTYSPEADEIAYAANSVIKYVKELKKQGKDEEAQTFLNKNKEIIIEGKALEPFQKQINALKKYKKQIEENVKIPENKKKEEISKIDERIDKLEAKRDEEFEKLKKKRKPK